MSARSSSCAAPLAPWLIGQLMQNTQRRLQWLRNIVRSHCVRTTALLAVMRWKPPPRASRWRRRPALAGKAARPALARAQIALRLRCHSASPTRFSSPASWSAAQAGAATLTGRRAPARGVAAQAVAIVAHTPRELLARDAAHGPSHSGALPVSHRDDFRSFTDGRPAAPPPIPSPRQARQRHGESASSYSRSCSLPAKKSA